MRAFDDQPHLTDGVFSLRPLAASDRDPLHAAASDPLIWAGHPAKTRGERAEFDPYFDFLLESGGALIIETAEGVAGCSRFYESPDIAGDIGIGYTFLTRAHWGGDANLRIKRLMLDHAFGWFDAVWFHIAPDNIRSRKATAKIGAAFVDEGLFNLSDKDAEWARYRLTKQAWAG